MRALHKNILFFALLLAAITLKHNEVKQKTPPTTISSFYGLETSSTKTGWNGPQELERVLQGKFRPLIVIFSAEWCGPCRDLRKVVNSMGWREKVLIVNVDKEEVERVSMDLSLEDSVPGMYYLHDKEVRLSGFYDIVEFLNIILLKEDN
jgi:thiol-disulfide isomerase/thioredoxin